MRPRKRRELLPLAEATRRLHPFARVHLGVRAVPLSRIVGSEGREGDFDRGFVPRRRAGIARRRAVGRAFPAGDFPPIAVEMIGDAYFVVDGHHRVSLARSRGMETIDADVTALRTRWQLDADSDDDDLVHGEQEWIFMRASGLERSRPAARIRFSLPIGYSELLESVEAHGYSLLRDAGAIRPAHEVAADWYDRVYLPTIASIRRGSITRFCRNATDGDRFLHVLRVLRQLRLDCGGATLEDAVRSMAPLA